MSISKQLGHIDTASFGLGGYQDAMLGFSFVLEGDHWGVSDFWGHWAGSPGDNAKWTYEDQTQKFAEASRAVLELLKKARVNRLEDLSGIPIEITFENNVLKSWRILTEVLPR
jgi:hypothetical protein